MIDPKGKTAMQKLVPYHKHEWRWRIQSRNRKIVGASSESFKRLSRCLDNLRQVTGVTIWKDDYDKKFGDKARFLVTWDDFKSLKRMQRGQPVML